MIAREKSNLCPPVTPPPGGTPSTPGRKHVLFMIDQLCEMGGAERVLLDTIRHLPQERFQSSLVTFKVDSSLAVFDNFPCPWYLLPIRRVYDRSGWRAALFLRRLIRSHRVDIVHTFFETSDLWGGLVSKLCGARVVSSRRDMGILRHGKHRIGYRVMNRIFDSVLTVSEQVRTFCLKQDRIAPDRIKTVYNGVELERFDIGVDRAALRRSLGIGADDPVVSTVAHIRRVKGIDTFVRAAAVVSRQIPNARFLVIGKNSESECFDELMALVQKLDLSRNVHFLGEREDILPLLKASDVFCLLSRSEGFSNALVEAMACALPCVATRVGGNGEAIPTGDCGFLVPPDDANEAGKRVLQLLQDPGYARTIGEAARAFVRQNFTTERMMQDVMDVYDGLFAPRPLAGNAPSQ